MNRLSAGLMHKIVHKIVFFCRNLGNSVRCPFCSHARIRHTEKTNEVIFEF